MAATKVKPTNGSETTTEATPEKKKRVQKPRPTRVAYPGLKDADGKAVKLSEVPADYDRKIHKDLKRGQFTDDAQFFGFMASRAQAKVDFFLRKAEEAKRVGNTADRARAKKLLKMREQMAALRKQLEEQNVDVDALLASATVTE